MQTERAFVWRHQWVFKLCAIYVIFFTSRVPLSRLIEQFLTTGNFQPKKKMWVRRTFQVGRQAANKSVAFFCSFPLLTSCEQRPFRLPSSCRNCNQELKLRSKLPLLIFLKAMAVSVVVTFHPSITLACLNHLSDWVNVIWLPSDPDSPNLENASN